MQTETVLHLDPAKVLANPEDNAARFSAQSDTSRQEMMDSILSNGGVLQPVAVTALPAGVKGGFTHKLIYGFRRHGAVLELNKSQKAGLTLPVIVREVEDADVIKQQIAENNDRQNMSPMDKAIAIQHMLNTGVTKPEIRRVFAVQGGKKGTEIVPMSNASLNIHLNFLKLPKTIQQKIHNGTVGVSAAYLLGKVAPDQREAVLAKAEAEREKALETEEKDEEKFLAAEKKLEEAEQHKKDAATLVETAEADLKAAEALEVEKKKAYAKVGNEIKTSETPATPKDVERLKAAEADKKGAEKTLKDAKAKLEKARKDALSAEEKAKEKAAQVEAARTLKKNATKGKAGKTKGKAVTRDDVKKANPASGTVAISMSDLRQSLKDLQKDGVPARVSQVGALFMRLLNGELTPKLLITDLDALIKSAAKDTTAK